MSEEPSINAKIKWFFISQNFLNNQRYWHIAPISYTGPSICKIISFSKQKVNFADFLDFRKI